MRDNGGVTRVLRHTYRIDGFGNRADLIELNQNGVTGFLFNTALQPFGVGNKEVVADNLNFTAEFFGQTGIALPIILIERIFNRNDRISVYPLFVDFDHLIRSKQLVGIGLPEFIAFAPALVEQFGRSAVKRDGNIGARLVACLIDSLHNILQRRFVIDIRSKTAFIADRGCLTVRL